MMVYFSFLRNMTGNLDAGLGTRLVAESMCLFQLSLSAVPEQS